MIKRLWSTYSCAEDRNNGKIIFDQPNSGMNERGTYVLKSLSFYQCWLGPGLAGRNRQFWIQIRGTYLDLGSVLAIEKNRN